MPKCPRCQSDIPDGDTKCSFCHQDFPELTDKLADIIAAEKQGQIRRIEPEHIMKNPSPSEIDYAGFWRRLGATIPDLAIAGIFALFIQILLAQLKIPCTLSDILIITAIFYLVFYSPLCIHSRYQATFGKIFFGIIVSDSNGRRLSYPRALIRELGKYISLILFGTGFFMIGFTQRKQGLHDLLALTVVTDRSGVVALSYASSVDAQSVKKRLQLATGIIIICFVCSVFLIVYVGMASSRSFTASGIVAYSISSAGDTLASSDYPEYSLAVYDTSIALQPNDTTLLMKKIYVLGNMGNVKEARAYLDRMVVLYPDEMTPVIYKGDLFVKEGKFTEALACYEKAIAADPKNAKIWVKKGDTHLFMAVTEMTKVRDMYRNLTASSGRPESTRTIVSVDTFRATQPYQDAVKAYNKAIELDPMTSIAISGRILSSTQNLLDTYEGILDDINTK